MHDELAKLDSLRHQGILSEDAYWDARSRLYAPAVGLIGPAHDVAPQPGYEPAHRPMPYATTDPTPYASRSSRHEKRRRRPVLLVVPLLLLVVAGAGAGAYFLWFRDTSVTVNATYVLEDEATASADCVGQGTNSSIAKGSQVRLLDATNEHELAHSELPTGTSSAGSCTFHLQFTSVPEEISSYSLVVPGFPRETMTHDELRAHGWQFSVKQDPPSGPMTGTLELSDIETVINDCSGTGGYDDIDEGTEVVIRDQDQRILGSGSLDAGTSSDYATCTYTFSVPDIRRDQEQYTVEVSHRGEITASRDELAGRDWSFSLSLGS